MTIVQLRNNVADYIKTLLPNVTVTTEYSPVVKTNDLVISVQPASLSFSNADRKYLRLDPKLTITITKIVGQTINEVADEILLTTDLLIKTLAEYKDDTVRAISVETEEPLISEENLNSYNQAVTRIQVQFYQQVERLKGE